MSKTSPLRKEGPASAVRKDEVFRVYLACFSLCGLDFAAAVYQDHRDQLLPVCVLLGMKATELTAKVEATHTHTHICVAASDSELKRPVSVPSQRWTCAARLTVVAQSLPSAPNSHRGREAAPVKVATQVTGPCAWVGCPPTIRKDIYLKTCRYWMDLSNTDWFKVEHQRTVLAVTHQQTVVVHLFLWLCRNGWLPCQQRRLSPVS